MNKVFLRENQTHTRNFRLVVFVRENIIHVRIQFIHDTYKIGSREFLDEKYSIWEKHHGTPC